MKHLFWYIVFCFAIFNSVVRAQPLILPDDFEGPATKQILQTYKEGEEHLRLGDRVSIMWEVGEYLFDKYSPEEMSDEDFIEKLRPFFPKDDDATLESRRRLLYNGYNIYQYGKQKYTELVDKYLVPHSFKKVRSAVDYDHPDDVPYIEAKEGEYVKVYNFKKFLTYSQNDDERAAIVEFEKKQKNGTGWADKFNQAVQKIEWKKVPLYGIKYDNPLYSQSGISESQKTKFGSMRLAAKDSYIENRQELVFALQGSVEAEKFVPANNISPYLKKPQICLENSQNIADDYQIIYPLPLKSVAFPEVHKYTNEYIILLKVKPLDVHKPVLLRANVEISECDYQMQCEPQELTFAQKLEPAGEELLGNGMSNYLARAEASAPREYVKQLQLTNFAVEQDPETKKQSLFAEFSTHKKVDKFDIFAEEVDGYTTFKAPLVSLRTDKITVRLEPSDEYADADLNNSEFILTANLNNRYFWRQTLVPTASLEHNNFDKIRIGNLLSALFCGFLFNLMPCVFLLLVHKMNAMFRLHKKSTITIRRDIDQVLSGFGLGAVIFGILMYVIRLKQIPYGWGMHLQNMPYLLTVLFGGMAVIMLLPQLIAMAKEKKQDKLFNVCFGVLLWVAAGVCGSPYLSETINLMIYTDIAGFMLLTAAVSLGFALPLLWLHGISEPQKVICFVHYYRQAVKVMYNFAIMLALLWLCLLIMWQTGIVFVCKITVLLLILCFVLRIFIKFLQFLDGVHDEAISQRQIGRIRYGSYIFMAILWGVIIAVVSTFAIKQQIHHLKQIDGETVAIIDLAQINKETALRHPVLVRIEAHECFLCQMNDIMVFNKINLKKWKEYRNLRDIQVIYGADNQDIRRFMQRYGHDVSLPFYVLYTPQIRQGIVLPQTLGVSDIERLFTRN